MISEGNTQFSELEQNEISSNTQNGFSDAAQSQNNNEIPDNQNGQNSESDDDNSSEPANVNEDELLDKFSYYFIDFMKQNEESSPNPSYFSQLTEDENHLLHVFKTYFNQYRNSK